MKPRILDLFCKQGGASAGYARAGFEVVGIDIEPQPRYPFLFIQADAIWSLWALADGEALPQRDELGRQTYCGRPFTREDFVAIHASPPCQAYTKAVALQGTQAHPQLIDITRDSLNDPGLDLPYVIENVKGAPLRNPQMLEGQMFGLNTHRPRLFETNWGYEAPHLRPPPPRQAKMGRPPKAGEAIQVVGHFSDVEAARKAMGTPWMTQDGMREAIPPAYTEAIGSALLDHLQTAQKAAA